MRRYSQDDEEKIRLQLLLREWHRSGLLPSDQTSQLKTDLRVELRRTNPFFRLVLFFFTLVIVSSFVFLIVEVFGIDDKLPAAITLLVAGVVCFLVAEHLIARFHLYRFGIEEALAVAGVVLSGSAATVIPSFVGTDHPGVVQAVIALSVGAVGGFGIYCRYGYLYAALGAMICAAAIPFQIRLSDPTERITVAVIFAAVFCIVRPKRLQHSDEFLGDDYGILQSAAWAGLYLVLNLKVSFSSAEGWFYWSTYVMTWVLPVLGLRMGLRGRDRVLLDVNLGLALVTLVTNKAYLGLPRHAWDPILFGLFLMGTAITIRRWLFKGAENQRYGYTPARLLAGDRSVLGLAGSASVVVPTDVPLSHDEPVKPDFGGGRSGGAGASGNF